MKRVAQFKVRRAARRNTPAASAALLRGFAGNDALAQQRNIYNAPGYTYIAGHSGLTLRSVLGHVVVRFLSNIRGGHVVVDRVSNEAVPALHVMMNLWCPKHPAVYYTTRSLQNHKKSMMDCSAEQ